MKKDLLALLLFGLVLSCQNELNDPNIIVGNWTAIESTPMGERSFSYKFNNDGTFTFDQIGEGFLIHQAGKFHQKNDEISLDNKADGEQLTLRFAHVNDELILSFDHMIWHTFKRK